MRGLSLFSGIGGLDLAFEWAGGTVEAMCEIDPYCRKVLQKHWPDIPLFEDVRRLKGEDVGAVDIIYGGFPCQPFSVAGNQKGRDDERYLWPEFSRLVGELKPRWVVAENVPGILHIAADDVCADLERQGYSVGIFDFEAAAVGAPHRRERIFFVAHSDSSLRQRSDESGNFFKKNGTRNAVKSERPSSTFIPDTSSTRQHWSISGRLQTAFAPFGLLCRWKPEPRMGRVAHGIPNRVDRIRALGNAVVPQQAYPIFQAILEQEGQR